MEDQNGFGYWKRPWQKWLLVLAAAFQLWSAWTSYRGYKMMASSDIYSADVLADVTAKTYWHCAVSIWAAVTFLGVFFIGISVKNQKQADFAGGLFSLFLAALWSGICLQFDMFRAGGLAFLYAAVPLALLGFGAFSVWKSRKK